jgi:hypothetical protein
MPSPQSVPASRELAQIVAGKASTEVKDRQKVPGNGSQSASVVQPGKQISPLEELWTHELVCPRESPPLAPNPTQSEACRQVLLHHRPTQESPTLHVVSPGTHGSPVPDWLHTGHREVSQGVRLSRIKTPFGKSALHMERHAESVHAFSQLNKF